MEFVDQSIKISNQEITLDIFYLTSLLLNYDVSERINNLYSKKKNFVSKFLNYINKQEDNINYKIDEKQVIIKLLEDISINTIYPLELLLNKLFEYMLWKNINFCEIATVFFEKINMNVEDENEVEEKFKNYFDIIKKREVKFKPYDYNQIITKIEILLNNKLINLSYDKEKDKKKVLHRGQPLPDILKGRPQLKWKYCKYDGCNEQFTRTTDLVCHLLRNNVYTRGYHSSHEDGVEITGLTPEKVLEKNIVHCPSLMCENNNFLCPEELIKHLQILGIKPFWQPGMVFPKEYNKIEKFIEKPKNMYLVTECLICFENPVEILINKCGHQVYCIDCLIKANKSNCPVCRGKADIFYPYA